MKKFEFFDVTADIGFYAYGNNLNEAFENAGLIKKFESKFNEPETRSWKRKRPTGTLKVYDTYLRRDVPVKGVKVRCHTVVKWSTAFTDENGYYSMGSKFRIGPHYAVVFDNS